MFDHNRFDDRNDAGERLLTRLSKYGGCHPLILGVPLAKTVADRLGGELDVVLAQKFAALVSEISVAARQNLERLKLLANKIVCVNVPNDLGSISHLYRDSRVVADDEVVRMLAPAGSAGARHGHP